MFHKPGLDSNGQHTNRNIHMNLTSQSHLKTQSSFTRVKSHATIRYKLVLCLCLTSYEGHEAQSYQHRKPRVFRIILMSIPSTINAQGLDGTVFHSCMHYFFFFFNDQELGFQLSTLSRKERFHSCVHYYYV